MISKRSLAETAQLLLGDDTQARVVAIAVLSESECGNATITEATVGFHPELDNCPDDKLAAMLHCVLKAIYGGFRDHSVRVNPGPEAKS